MAALESLSALESITPSQVDMDSTEASPLEAAPKPKGRQRLLRSLQRISSSSSLVLGRKRASSNPYTFRSARASTISLSNSSASQSASSSSFPRLVPGHQATTPGPSIGTPTVASPSPLANVQINLTLRPQTANLDYLRADTRSESSPESVPLPHSRNAIQRSSSDIPELVQDYFSHPISKPVYKPRIPNRTFDFWKDMPHEIKLLIFTYLKPKELVRASIVSRAFHRICFDGQLWTCFDASEFYTDIPAESLAKIIEAAGPFVKDLNLRGCVQVDHYNRADVVVKSCKNLINATLEGCRNFQRATLHTLLTSNERLAHLNLTGLVAVNNASCKIISRSCPQLESFNVSWCSHMDSRGIKMVLAGCPKLRDLRVGEIRGFSGPSGLEVGEFLFESNNLERLVLSGCTDLSDATLQTIISGVDPQIDILSGLPLVEPRKLRHLDLSRCARITDQGLKVLAHNTPLLEGLQLSSCNLLTDSSLSSVISTTPNLTHLDLEELSELTNTFLSEHLAKSPCASRLEHLSISYCENLGDSGMLPVVRACTSLRSVEMDNTRISDLVLAEAASMVRARSARGSLDSCRPQVSLRLVVFDCGNVTWTGVREILSRNAENRKFSAGAAGKVPTFSKEVIGLKCFYGWQMTVDEHMNRVLKGDLAAASRLERRWAEYMVANEEAGAAGAGARRRRRRAREAAMLHADEEEGEGEIGMGGIGRRRRARSNGCEIM